MKNRKNPYAKLSKEECLRLLESHKKQIAELESRQRDDEKKLAELSARKAFLDEVNEQNMQLLKGKNLL